MGFDVNIDTVIDWLAVIGGFRVILELFQNIYHKLTNKLFVEFYRKRFIVSDVGKGDYDVEFDFTLKFKNRLGEDTTIDEVVIEYADGNSNAAPDTIRLTKNDVKRRNYRIYLGKNIIRLNGTLVINHALGDVRLPIDEIVDEMAKILSEKSAQARTS